MLDGILWPLQFYKLLVEWTWTSLSFFMVSKRLDTSHLNQSVESIQCTETKQKENILVLASKGAFDFWYTVGFDLQ